MLLYVQPYYQTMTNDPESKGTIWYFQIWHDGWKIKAFTLHDCEILKAQVLLAW
jgi:hypothetical protein